MWNSENDNQALPPGVTSIERQQKKYNIHGDIKTLLERFEVEKEMRI